MCKHGLKRSQIKEQWRVAQERRTYINKVLYSPVRKWNYQIQNVLTSTFMSEKRKKTHIDYTKPHFQLPYDCILTGLLS